MAISLRGNKELLARLKPLMKLRRFNHTLDEGCGQTHLYAQMDSESIARQDLAPIDMSKWKKVDARKFDINRWMIPTPSWTVLKVLHSKGFEAYLVGGCVRDLLLKKVPKDFDVITTARLEQIRKQFGRARIVGRRFPICMVHIKDSVIEVSSFETVARQEKELRHAKEKELRYTKEKELISFSQMPRGCAKNDYMRWKNSIERDFTINSLFFDPFSNIIYDYTKGMADLKSLKLRTLIPAQLSFKEDCARILRGLRIAARLGLSLSRDTETAMHNLSSSIKRLDRSRIMMELNYMLAYGAAVPSLCLLQRFNLLEILLPFHAAYLDQQALKKSLQNSVMLMKLFRNLDKVVSCDRPSDCILWIGLLAFHLASVNNPQDALIVLAFAATLYHGGWVEGVQFARENSQVHSNFVPEIKKSSQLISDEEIANGISQFASLVKDSIFALHMADYHFESTSTCPISPCLGLVFISKKTANDVAEMFEVLINDIKLYKDRRQSLEINYQLLGKGNIWETRFVLGKVILETMIGSGSEIPTEEKNKPILNNTEEKCNPVKDRVVAKKDRKRGRQTCTPEVNQETTRKQMCVEKDSIRDSLLEKNKFDLDLWEVRKQQETLKEKHQESHEKVTNKLLRIMKE